MDLLIEKLEQYVTNASVSDSSQSFIPFYDTVLPADKKNMLGQVKMHPLIEHKVQALNNLSLSENVAAA